MEIITPSEMINNINSLIEAGIIKGDAKVKFKQLFTKYDDAYSHYEKALKGNSDNNDRSKRLVETIEREYDILIESQKKLPSSLATIVENAHIFGEISDDAYIKLTDSVNQYQTLFQQKDNGDEAVIDELNNIYNEVNSSLESSMQMGAM